MNSKHDFDQISDSKLVYIRSVRVEDLPQDLQQHAEGRETLYAVHDKDGAPLALVAERSMAFHLARHNNLCPVTVH